jgi:hypothetical protein
MTPMANPVGTIVTHANPSNVEHVLVGGRFVKRDGALVGIDLDRAHRLAEEASERVLGAVQANGPLLPPADPALLEAINTMARMNLARAWTIEPADLG